MNLRQQGCIVEREEGRKICISRRDGKKVETQKERKIKTSANSSELGSHKVLMLRAPTEGVADLWCAWIKSAALCGVGGEEIKSVDSNLFEDWQLIVPIPKNVIQSCSNSRIESLVDNINQITRENKKHVKEMKFGLHVEPTPVSVPKAQNSNRNSSENRRYPASPIDLSNVETLHTDSSSSSDYDCDSDVENSVTM